MLILLYPLTTGTVVAVTSLLCLQCLCGMVWGLVISLYCGSRESVIQLALAIIFPMFLLSGILWPAIG